MADIDNRVIQEDSPKRFIETLQRQLIRENPSALPNYGVDGELGPETTLWVERFQERKGLEVDGVAGPETLGRLRADIIYRRGDSGKGVELLQENLMYFTVKLSYGASGEYGSGTEQGVKDFQYFNLMEVDGVAGPATFKKMDELYETIIVQSGDEGALVRRIQEQLNEQESVSISITVDGGYGPSTISAVKKFQEENDQKVDGIAGPVTMNLLDLEALHPLSGEDLVSYLGSKGFTSQSISESESYEYTSELENSDVYSNVISESNEKIDNPIVLGVRGNNKELACVMGALENNEYKVVFSTLDLNTKEVYSIGTFELDGESYNDKITVKVYDGDGNQVESVEDSYIEFINEDLLLRLTFAEGLEESRQVQTMSIDLTSCEAYATYGAGLANYGAVEAAALLAGGAAPVLITVAGGVLMGYFFVETFC